MEIKRFINILAVKLRNNELIPIWDSRVSYAKTEMYGEILQFEGSSREVFETVECLYDLKNKTISLGIELDHYPLEKDLEYKKGETVYYEKRGRELSETSIIDILYEDYDLSIQKGKKIDKYWIEKYKIETFNKDSIYSIKHWKPTYVLANGVKTEWTHELYHKKIETKI